MTAIFYLVDRTWDGRPEVDGGNLVWWHVDEPGAAAADESCKCYVEPKVPTAVTAVTCVTAADESCKCHVEPKVPCPSRLFTPLHPLRAAAAPGPRVGIPRCTSANGMRPRRIDTRVTQLTLLRVRSPHLCLP